MKTALRQVGDPGDHIGERGMRIDVVEATGQNERIHGRGTVSHLKERLTGERLYDYDHNTPPTSPKTSNPYAIAATSFPARSENQSFLKFITRRSTA